MTTALATPVRRAGKPTAAPKRITIDDENWRTKARCRTREEDPEEFFPANEGDTGYALAVCKRCPVILLCREYALANQEVHGIWGGLTPRQRARIWKMSRDWSFQNPGYSG